MEGTRARAGASSGGGANSRRSAQVLAALAKESVIHSWLASLFVGGFALGLLSLARSLVRLQEFPAIFLSYLSRRSRPSALTVARRQSANSLRLALAHSLADRKRDSRECPLMILTISLALSSLVSRRG